MLTETKYCLYSESNEEIQSLLNILKTLIAKHKNEYQTDDGIGIRHLAVALGGKKEELLDINGSFFDMYGTNPVILILPEYLPNKRINNLIKEKFPSVQIYWLIESHKYNIFETNDSSHKFFHEKYYCCYFNDEEYFNSDEELLDAAEDYYKRDFGDVKDLKSYMESIGESWMLHDIKINDRCDD